MVRELPAGAAGRTLARDDGDDGVRVLQVLEAEDLRREVLDAGAVDQDVADRDPLLPVGAELGDVLADRVVQAEQVPLVEQVDHHRRHRLRRRQRDERRVGRQRDGAGIRRIAGTVAAGVPDGAVEEHLPVAADAEGERGMHAAPVEALGRFPDAIARRGVDAQLARRDLGFPADARDRVQIGRHARTR